MDELDGVDALEQAKAILGDRLKLLPRISWESGDLSAKLVNEPHARLAARLVEADASQEILDACNDETMRQAFVIVHLVDIAVKAIAHAELLLGGRLPALDDFLNSSLYVSEPAASG